MQYGRAELKALDGKESSSCENCGVRHATMYALSLAKQPGREANITWLLCVDCKSHLSHVFEKHSKSFDGY